MGTSKPSRQPASRHNPTKIRKKSACPPSTREDLAPLDPLDHAGQIAADQAGEKLAVSQTPISMDASLDGRRLAHERDAHRKEAELATAEDEVERHQDPGTHRAPPSACAAPNTITT